MTYRLWSFLTAKSPLLSNLNPLEWRIFLGRNDSLSVLEYLTDVEFMVFNKSSFVSDFRASVKFLQSPFANPHL